MFPTLVQAGYNHDTFQHSGVFFGLERSTSWSGLSEKDPLQHVAQIRCNLLASYSTISAEEVKGSFHRDICILPGSAAHWSS
jgi:hypothetical protein